MNFEEYTALDRMNASTLCEGFKSMLALKRAIDGDRPEETAAMRFGQQYHSLLLEPEQFERTHVVEPDFPRMEGNVDKKGNRSTSAVTKWVTDKRKEFRSNNSEKVIVSQDHFDRMQAMRRSLMSKPFVRQLLDGAETEVTVTEKLSKTDCKGRIDILKWGAHIADIKGTSDVRPSIFGTHACRYRYPEKMAFYRELVAKKTGELLPVYLIAIETDGDFDCVVYQIPDAATEAALGRIQRLLLQYEDALSTNHWPGVDEGDEVLPFPVPNWWMPEEEDDIQWEKVAD